MYQHAASKSRERNSNLQKIIHLQIRIASLVLEVKGVAGERRRSRGKSPKKLWENLQILYLYYWCFWRSLSMLHQEVICSDIMHELLETLQHLDPRWQLLLARNQNRLMMGTLSHSCTTTTRWPRRWWRISPRNVLILRRCTPLENQSKVANYTQWLSLIHPININPVSLNLNTSVPCMETR